MPIALHLGTCVDNRRMTMSRTVRGCGCALVCLLTACNPSYNWREVRLDNAVGALLPCQPDTALRPIELLGHRVTMEMKGCEAGAGMFVLARVQLDDPAQTRAAAEHWKAAVLAHLRADEGVVQAPADQSAVTGWAPLRLTASGRQPAGEPVNVQALWIARGATLYHGAIYYRALPQDVVDMFFAELATP